MSWLHFHTLFCYTVIIEQLHFFGLSFHTDNGYIKRDDSVSTTDIIRGQTKMLINLCESLRYTCMHNRNVPRLQEGDVLIEEVVCFTNNSLFTLTKNCRSCIKYTSTMLLKT